MLSFEIMKNKDHLTLEGLANIYKIKAGMNSATDLFNKIDNDN